MKPWKGMNRKKKKKVLSHQPRLAEEHQSPTLVGVGKLPVLPPSAVNALEEQ